jgi:N6-adenosine-specific RNA methylase IME4
VSKLSLGVQKAAESASALVTVPPILPTSRARLSEVSLELPEDLNYEEWAQLGRALDRMEHAVQWWRGDWWAFGGLHWRERLELVGKDKARSYAVSGVVSRAFKVLRRRNTLTFAHHQEVAGFTEDQQDYWLDRAAKEGWSRNELRREIRRARQVARISAVLPPDVYNVLLADPPWQYDFAETDSRNIDVNQYPTLPVEEIKDYHDGHGRSIADAIADDAILFLWATSPKLQEALTVMEGWGFDYRTGAVWVKDRVGMGYYVREQHELLLIGKRGDFPPPPQESDRRPSVIQAPRGAHSRKPDEVYELVEAMYPTGKWMECFQRRGRPGWAAFGNEPTE